jgi:hypothetical protein
MCPFDDEEPFAAMQQDDGQHRPRRLANRDAQLLMPRLRLMNASSGSGGDLYAKAYRRRRDHFDRVRLSTFAGSAAKPTLSINFIQRESLSTSFI